MKPFTFLLGAAVGMAVAASALTTAYPDVSRRMMRDGRRICRCTKRAMSGMFS